MALSATNHFGGFLLLFIGTCVGCARSEPPGARTAEATPQPIGTGASSGDAPPHRTPSQVTEVNDAATAVHSGAPLAVAAVPPPASPAADNDSLVDVNGQPKPQTSDKPNALDPQFKARISLLCDAILEGKPEKAHDAFFPLIAYRQVKAIEDPDRDYKFRLLRHFDRDILDYHRRLAKRAGPVRCVGITVPEAQARWMKPGSEYNRIGYFRVLRSQLSLTDASQNTFPLEVTSLISWRGQWYVVHLNGFE